MMMRRSQTQTDSNAENDRIQAAQAPTRTEGLQVDKGVLNI